MRTVVSIKVMNSKKGFVALVTFNGIHYRIRPQKTLCQATDAAATFVRQKFS